MPELGRMEALIDNAHGCAPVLLICEHASNAMPAGLPDLGLPAALMQDHVAWDIGAHALARRLSAALDAPLIAAPVSRLIIDPNRGLTANDLIPLTAEGTPVPGNEGLSAEAREARAAAFHAPFHEAIAAMLAARPDVLALMAVHSFTPVLFGAARPWHAGVLHGDDRRIADVMLDVLTRDKSLSVGRNEPYAPSQGVFYTMNRHGAGRATVMIEVRNDLIRDETGQALWARRLAEAVSTAVTALGSAGASSAMRGGSRP